MTDLPWRETPEGLRLNVRVTPRAAHDGLDGIGRLADGRAVLRVKVRAVASEGEANVAVVMLLARVLDLPRAKVALVSGATSRLKSPRLTGGSEWLKARLSAVAGLPPDDAPQQRLDAKP